MDRVGFRISPSAFCWECFRRVTAGKEGHVLAEMTVTWGGGGGAGGCTGCLKKGSTFVNPTAASLRMGGNTGPHSALSSHI